MVEQVVNNSALWAGQLGPASKRRVAAREPVFGIAADIATLARATQTAGVSRPTQAFIDELYSGIEPDTRLAVNMALGQNVQPIRTSSRAATTSTPQKPSWS